MDISEEYIKMCERAQEVQELKDIKDWKLNESFKDYTFKINEFYSKNIPEGFIRIAVTSYIGRELPVDDFIVLNKKTLKHIWLPMQDQLSEMIVTWNKKYSMAFFQNIVSNSEYRNVPKEGFDSIEKHLLTFVMKDKYNKIWDNKRECWMLNKK